MAFRSVDVVCWRIGVDDLEDYIAEAYQSTANRIAGSEFACRFGT